MSFVPLLSLSSQCENLPTYFFLPLQPRRTLARLLSASKRFTQAVWSNFKRSGGHDANSFGHVNSFLPPFLLPLPE